MTTQITAPVGSGFDEATHAGTTAPGEHAGHETLLGLDSYGWVGLAFLAFVLLLWRFGVFGMLARALDSQADRVRSELAEAAALKAEAEAMRARAAADAAQAEADARTMLSNAEAEAQRIMAQAGVDAEAAIARRQKLASDRLAAESRAAEAELRARAAEISLKAAQTLLAERAAAGQLAGLTDSAIGALDRR